MKDPCKDCPDILQDGWGYLCDVSCGKHSAYKSYQVGIKEVVEWINKNTELGFTRQDEWEAKLKEWGIE